MALVTDQSRRSSSNLSTSGEALNALTVDVEDYYQVEAFSDVVKREDWPKWESRVEKNTFDLLELFARHGVRATFFVLGYVAEMHPSIVKAISEGGHEVACHGYHHRLIYKQTPEEFRADIRKSLDILQSQSGTEIIGYRAPSYSITNASMWALDVLLEEGIRYDSSIFPVHHDRYGVPDAERFPHVLKREKGTLVEFPPSTVRLGSMNLPISGGGYFRIFPYQFFRWGWKRINQTEDESAIFFLHPWEIDPDQPVVPGSRVNILRHRLNLSRTKGRLEKLLRDFKFAPVCEVLAQVKPELNAAAGGADRQS